MHDDDAQLVRTTVEKLCADLNGEALTAELDFFGWAELLDVEPQVIVPALFGAMGRNGRWCAAFQDLLAAALESSSATVLLDPARSSSLWNHRPGDA